MATEINKSSNMVALVISTAYPEDKFPKIDAKFITIPEQEVDNYLLEDIYLLITGGYDPELVKSINGIINGIEYIENFWTEYYKYTQMGNKPWKAMVWENGEWKSRMPSNETIWEYPLNDYRCFNTYGVRDAIQPENAVFGRYPHNQDLRIF